MTPTQRQAIIDLLARRIAARGTIPRRDADWIATDLVDGPLASVIDLLDRMADYDADVDDEAEDVFDVFRRLDSVWRGEP